MQPSSSLSHAPTGTRAVLLGGIASGLGAYGFTILGARVLGEVAYAPVGVLWTLQYLVLTVGLLSLEALVTRERTVPVMAWRWVGGLTLGLTFVTALASSRLLGSASPVWPTTAGMTGLAFGLFVLARGRSAGEGDFVSYGVMTGGESLVRLAVAAVVLTFSPTAEALALTLPVGAAVAVLGWPIRRGGRLRDAPPASLPRAPAVVARAGGFLAATTTANAMVQVLLAGGPLLTAAIGAAPAVTSRVFVTTTAARAPLVLVYSGLLSRLLTALQGQPTEVLRRWVRRGAPLALLATGLGAAGGWVLGPPLVALAFGEGLRPSATFAALTGASVVLSVMLLAANQLLIAVRHDRLLPLPWAAGMAVGLLVAALTGGPADIRAGLASVCGLLAAGLLLLPSLRTATASR